jgi:hypothetical protein
MEVPGILMDGKKQHIMGSCFFEANTFNPVNETMENLLLRAGIRNTKHNLNLILPGKVRGAVARNTIIACGVLFFLVVIVPILFVRWSYRRHRRYIQRQQEQLDLA